MSSQEVEYEEVEEEVEVSEDGNTSEGAKREPLSKGSASTPGKVVPSKSVKGLKLSSPEAKAREAADGSLTPAKNPFTTRGKWSPKTFSEVTILFPAFTSKAETTNDLTRATRPEARYWKVPVSFTYSTFSSATLRVSNVPIPYHTGAGYGDSFVYVCLPGFMAGAFAEAGKSRRPTVVTEASLKPDENRWWKIANNVEGKFGVVDKTTGRFHPKSLPVIFGGTGKGVIATLVCQFMAKASTDDKSQLTATVPQRLALEVNRGYIVSTDVDVQMPDRVPRGKPKVEPLAIREDIATDGLMKRLAELGL